MLEEVLAEAAVSEGLVAALAVLARTFGRNLPTFFSANRESNELYLSKDRVKSNKSSTKFLLPVFSFGSRKISSRKSNSATMLSA